MKVIDLLNKIANGEEVPSKIQLYGVTFYFKKEKECYFSKYAEINILDMYSHCLRNKGKLLLNEEVEIIEDKKIEEIQMLDDIFETKLAINQTRRKINEIIDYLEEKENE